MSVTNEVKGMLLAERAKIDAMLSVINAKPVATAPKAETPKPAATPAKKAAGKAWTPERRAAIMAGRERAKAAREAAKGEAPVESFDHTPPAEDATEAAE